ncbi:hypothetical protein DPEC_G00088880 [Dallia pectoralis]|uniref:Uncharacterized protein n=1 Tax=Dallia pectoralis TaxID=75939 RepID=A0ACC2H0E7_DALPE|nr:hypothetical protein DPEC_G00088880 [Dallia pectoralis]
MADIKHYFLCLVTVVNLLIGVSGDTQSLYTRVGDNVRLLCRNVVYQDCSSTTWMYHRTGYGNVIEQVGNGKIRTTSDRAGRLEVASDCSLLVSDVRSEDAGIYTCKQYLTVGGGLEGEDAPVYLSVLTDSLSKPVADIVPDRPVSLKCFLYTSDGPGKCLSGVTERIGLFWVGEAGNELKNDPRLQVTQTSDCDITLTVRVQKEDNNRKWTCQLNVNGNKEISIDFTFMVPGSRTSTAGPSLSTTSPSSTGTSYVEFPISRIMQFGMLTIMAAIIIIYMMRNRPPRPLHPQPEDISGIDLQVLEE